jgi:hypothetical protein
MMMMMVMRDPVNRVPDSSLLDDPDKTVALLYLATCESGLCACVNSDIVNFYSLVEKK